MNTMEFLLLGVPATLGFLKLGVLALTVALAAKVIFRPEGRPTIGPSPAQSSPQRGPRWAK